MSGWPTAKLRNACRAFEKRQRGGRFIYLGDHDGCIGCPTAYDGGRAVGPRTSQQKKQSSLDGIRELQPSGLLGEQCESRSRTSVRSQDVHLRPGDFKLAVIDFGNNLQTRTAKHGGRRLGLGGAYGRLLMGFETVAHSPAEAVCRDHRIDGRALQQTAPGKSDVAPQNALVRSKPCPTRFGLVS
jgi:hypothetical protein